MKYIPAEKLIAEIERLKGLLIRGACAAQVDMETNCKDEAYNEVLSFITSLQQEQPEVDLEEYIENEINHYGLSLYEASYGTFSASQIDRIIRNAFEHGLKAKKKHETICKDRPKSTV